MTIAVTRPVKSRLTCSMAPWVVETSMNFSELQRGQSEHPKPDPESRTAAPLTTITHNKISAKRLTQIYPAGLICRALRDPSDELIDPQ